MPDDDSVRLRGVMLALIKRGSVAGLWAGAAVALFFLVLDLFQLEPLATPRLLARNLMGGVAPAETAGGMGALAWLGDVALAIRGVAAYTAVHFAAFVLVGIAGAWCFAEGRLPINAGAGALFGVVAGTLLFGLGMAFFAQASLPSWTMVVLANAIAGVVIAAQLRHDREAAVPSG